MLKSYVNNDLAPWDLLARHKDAMCIKTFTKAGGSANWRTLPLLS